MKKMLLKIAIIVLALTLCISISACETPEDKERYVIEGYESTYIVNDDFSIQGVKLKIADKNGDVIEIPITEQMIKQMPNMSVVGTHDVVVCYEGQEYTFTITVRELLEVSREIVGIESSYKIDSNFDYSQLKLKICYENNTSSLIDITEQMIEKMPDMTREGMQELTINYAGVSTTTSIKIISDTKTEMLNKLQQFMADYDYSKVKSSAIKLNVSGTAKYLEDNIEFNQQLLNFAVSTVSNLEG